MNIDELIARILENAKPLKTCSGNYMMSRDGLEQTIRTSFTIGEREGFKAGLTAGVKATADNHLSLTTEQA